MIHLNSSIKSERGRVQSWLVIQTFDPIYSSPVDLTSLMCCSPSSSDQVPALFVTQPRPTTAVWVVTLIQWRALLVQHFITTVAKRILIIHIQNHKSLMSISYATILSTILPGYCLSKTRKEKKKLNGIFLSGFGELDHK